MSGIRPVPLRAVPVQARPLPPQSAAAAPRLEAGTDRWLLLALVLLSALGLLLVTSASMPIADNRHQEPFFFLYRQLAYLGMGLLLGVGVLRVPLEIWYRLSPWLLLLTMLLLVVVLIPGIGREVNGSRRWLDLGPVNLQVSELAKLGALLYMAGYIRRHGQTLSQTLAAQLRPLALLGVLVVLLLAEPDFGAAAVLLAAVLGMLFLAGVNLRGFLLVQGAVAAAMALVLVSSPYRLKRVLTFFDGPFQDPFGSGFQLVQALIAIGRGEVLGVGLGASVQKWFYLPEAYTDFIFAILAEELGLLGVLLVIVLYVTIIWRIFVIGARAEGLGWPFAAALAYGIGLWIALQTLINLGVNLGVLPTKGLTLPLISYGGSSLVVMCLALALVFRIDRETRRALAPVEDPS